MKETLERLLQENEEMIVEIGYREHDDYKIGYIQALLNIKSSLEYELGEL